MDTKIITPLQTTAKSANDKHPYVVSCVCRVPHPSLLSLSLCFKCTSFVLSLSPSVGPLPLIIQDFKKGDRRSPVSVDNMLNTHTHTHIALPLILPDKPLIPQAPVVSSLSTAKVIRKETHYPDPRSIMGEISVQIAAKSHRDSD